MWTQCTTDAWTIRQNCTSSGESLPGRTWALQRSVTDEYIHLLNRSQLMESLTFVDQAQVERFTKFIKMWQRIVDAQTFFSRLLPHRLVPRAGNNTS